MIMKICTKCKGDPKPLLEFYLNKKTGRYHSRCKSCSKTAVMEGRKNDPERRKKAKNRQEKRIDNNPKYKIKLWETQLKCNH